MSSRHRNSTAANDWAKKRQDAIEKAKRLRAERKRGKVSEEHTFQPQQISKPPSRENAQGHPGVYDRQGKDVFYDRQVGRYPDIPTSERQQPFPAQGGDPSYAAPAKRMSELDQLHQAGDTKFGKPRGGVPPNDYARRQPLQQQNVYGGNGGYQGATVEDELDRFYAGQFENQQQQQAYRRDRPKPKINVANHFDSYENDSSSRYGQVRSPNSDSLVHEARRVYNNPGLGRGGDGDFLTHKQQQEQRFLQEQQAYLQKNVHRKEEEQGLERDASRHKEGHNDQGYYGTGGGQANMHQEEANDNFQSWLRSDVDNSKTNGWNSDFTEANTLSRDVDSSGNKDISQPRRRRKKTVQNKRPEWNSNGTDEVNVDHAIANQGYNSHNSVPRQTRGPRMEQHASSSAQPYRQIISASDIIGGNGATSQSQTMPRHQFSDGVAQTPPHVKSNLRLLKKKVKRKTSEPTGYVQQPRPKWDDSIDDHMDSQEQPSGGQASRNFEEMDDPFNQGSKGPRAAPSYSDIDNQPLGGRRGGHAARSSGHGKMDQGYAPPEEQRRPVRQSRLSKQPQHAARRIDSNVPRDNDAAPNHQAPSRYRERQQSHGARGPAPLDREEPSLLNNSSMPDEHGPPVQLFACPHCSRKFNERAHKKHVPNCKKVFINKRKPMDMTANRIADAAAQSGDARDAIRKAKRAAAEVKRKANRTQAAQRKGRKDRRAGSKKVGGKWKQQSNALREAMKQSRMVSKYEKEGRLSELPPMQSSGPDPSFVPCPHCGRTFNEKAAERHIPKCNSIKAKPKFQRRGVGKSSSSRYKGAQGRGRF